MSHPKQGTGPHDRKQEIGIEKKSRTTAIQRLQPLTSQLNNTLEEQGGQAGLTQHTAL